MRYLIVDLDKIDTTDAKSDSALFILELKGIALSEEESLAKFKEIWEHGGEYVKYYDEGKGGDNYEYKDKHWEEFKKTL